MVLPSYTDPSRATHTSTDPQDAQDFQQDEGYFNSSTSNRAADSDTNAVSDLETFNAEGNAAAQQRISGQSWASRSSLSSRQEQDASQKANTVSASAANISEQDAFSSLLEDTAPQEVRRRYGVRSRRTRGISSQGGVPPANTAGTRISTSRPDRNVQRNGASRSHNVSPPTSASSLSAGLRDRRSRHVKEASATTSENSMGQRLNDRANVSAAAAMRASGDRSDSSSSTNIPQSTWYVDWGWDTDSLQEPPGPSSQRSARDRQASASSSDLASSTKGNRRQKARDAAASAGSKQQANAKGGWWKGFGPQKQDSPGEDEPARRSGSQDAAERDAFAADDGDGLWETVDDTAPDELLVRPDITRLEPAELVSSLSQSLVVAGWNQ